jgi:hypothetical protein
MEPPELITPPDPTITSLAFPPVAFSTLVLLGSEQDAEKIRITGRMDANFCMAISGVRPVEYWGNLMKVSSKIHHEMCYV